MNAAVFLIAGPLGAAALSATLRRFPTSRRLLSVAVLGLCIVASASLVAEVADGTVQVLHVGGWQWPLGITLVADPLAAIMLLVSSIALFAVLVYTIGSPRTDDTRTFFHPVYLILAAGVALSFLTGDLFNLFVAFEVSLMASYVLITFGGTRLQVKHGITYIVISLMASALFITAVGLVYAATGTVNLADLSVRLGVIDPGLKAGLGALILVVFGIKAAIFPLFFWLPDSYPAAPSPVTAIFAGLLTKVGVYAIIRSHTLLFGEAEPSTFLLAVAGLTMVVGILGAVAQDDVKRILSFHIVSQIGYMIFGLALFTVAGLAAAVIFLVHQIIVKTSLFLVAGLIEQRSGTSALRRVGGLLRSSPVLAALFIIAAMSLAGMPPSSGFIGKLALAQAGLAVGAYLTVAVSLGVSILTLYSMTKIWAGVFWGRFEIQPEAELVASQAAPRLMVASTAFLVAASVAFVVFAGPLYSFSEVAASGLIDPSVYVSAVTR